MKSFIKNNFKIKFLLVFLLLSSSFVYSDYAAINADESVQRAKIAIANAENLLKSIPSDSPEFEYLTDLLSKAKQDWEIALKSFNEYNQAAFEEKNTSVSEYKNAFNQVATISAQVAKVHADSVVLALSYLKLVSEDKLSGLEKVKESINELSEIKETVIDNKDYIEEIVINQISDFDNDGFSDAVELAVGTDPENKASYPDDSTKTDIDASLNVLNEAMNNVVNVSSSLTDLSIEMVEVLSESESDNFSIVEDIVSDINSLAALKDGAQDRFDVLTDVIDSSSMSPNLDETLEEIVTFIDLASEVSDSIMEGEDINFSDSAGNISFEVISDAIDENIEDNDLNIYTDIGQTQGYQDTMETLHDSFRDSTTTVDGGGFNESNATET